MCPLRLRSLQRPMGVYCVLRWITHLSIMLVTISYRVMLLYVLLGLFNHHSTKRSDTLKQGKPFLWINTLMSVSIISLVNVAFLICKVHHCMYLKISETPVSSFWKVTYLWDFKTRKFSILSACKSIHWIGTNFESKLSSIQDSTSKWVCFILQI